MLCAWLCLCSGENTLSPLAEVGPITPLWDPEFSHLCLCAALFCVRESWSHAHLWVAMSLALGWISG